MKIFATTVLQMVHSFPSLCRNCLCKALNAEKRRLNEVFDPRVYFKCREKLLTGLNAVFWNNAPVSCHCWDGYYLSWFDRKSQHFLKDINILMLHDSTLQGRIAWFCFASVNIFGNANKTTVFDADPSLRSSWSRLSSHRESVSMSRTKAPSCGLKQVQQRDTGTVCQVFSLQVKLQRCI